MMYIFYGRSKHFLTEGLTVLLSWCFSNPHTLESHVSSDYLLCPPQGGSLVQPRETMCPMQENLENSTERRLILGEMYVAQIQKKTCLYIPK